jgi:CheY-like chemotaxis protein
MLVTLKNEMINYESKSNRPASVDSGKLSDLQTSFRAAGIPHTVTVSSALATCCGWTDAGIQDVDPGVVAWVTAEALAGNWPCCRRQTKRGEVLLLECSTFRGKQPISLELGILVRPSKILELLNPEELNQPFWGHVRILLAEDDANLAPVLCELLERAGFQVVHAADGLETWRLALSVPFDIVILDVDMPGINGIEVCRRIKSAPALAQLPVLLCSGGHDLDTMAKQAGADGHVEKPAGLSELVMRLNALLLKPAVSSCQLHKSK